MNWRKDLGAIFMALMLVVLVHQAGHGQQQATPAEDQRVSAADVDPNSFGFSVSTAASSLGLKIRGLLGSKNGLDRVNDIVDPRALQYNYYRSALNVLSSWTKNSGFSGLVRVNQPPKPGFVNFFVLEHSHLAAKAPEFACNCSYVVAGWSIICDGLFLANAQRLLEGGPAAGKPQKADEPDKDRDDQAALEQQIQGMFRNFLFEWMIAHELGHLVNNHSEKDLKRSWTYDNGIPIGIAAEKEADEFYISRMQHNQQRQFGAWIGLSNVVTALYAKAVREQYKNRPDELKAQADKHGPRFIFDAELDIELQYVADKHPPLLTRALNLANLVIARYPQMYDSTGYFDKVRSRLKPKPGKAPDSPELCLTDNKVSDEDSSVEQVLAKHLDILVIQSAPRPWIEAAVDKLRQRVSQQQDPDIKNLSSLATDLAEALTQPDIAQARSGIETVERAGDGLPGPHKTTLRLLVFVAKARAGLLPDAMSVEAAVKSGEAQLNDLIAANGLDVSDPVQKMEALSLLLQIGLARGKQRDTTADGLLNAIVGEQLGLQDIAAIDKQMLLQILQADFTAMSQNNSLPDKTAARTRANAAARLVALADSESWYLVEVNFLAAQLALLEQVKPKPLNELMSGYFKLGRQVQFVRAAEISPAMFQKAIDNADAALSSSDTKPADRNRIADLRLKFLNNLGWSLLIVRKFPDAVAPLTLAREARLAARAGRTVCDKAHPDDVALAIINQNLADVSLALGQYGQAAELAHQARQCRTELDLKDKIIESTKTEGYALFYSGNKDAGLALITEYGKAIRRFLDDDVLPAGDPFISGAIVNGSFVPLEQFVQFPDKNRPIAIPMRKPTPSDIEEKP